MYNSSDLFATGIGGFSSVFGVLICAFYCGIILLSIAVFIFWLWMLIDAIQRTDDQFGESLGKDGKLIWIIIMLITGVVSSLIYYFLVYKRYPRH